MACCPSCCQRKGLSWGNGIIELGTFLAAITATMASGILAERFHGRQYISGAMLLGFTCFDCSRALESHESCRGPGEEIPLESSRRFGAQLKTVGADRTLTWAVLGNTYLWFLAAAAAIHHHRIWTRRAARDRIADQLHAGGSWNRYRARELLPRVISPEEKLSTGLIPLGAVGMTVFGALLYFPGRRSRCRVAARHRTLGIVALHRAQHGSSCDGCASADV